MGLIWGEGSAFAGYVADTAPENHLGLPSIAHFGRSPMEMDGQVISGGLHSSVIVNSLMDAL